MSTLDAKALYYWSTNGINQPMPFVDQSVKRFYIHICQIRDLICFQSKVWIVRKKTKTIDIIFEVLSDLNRIIFFLHRIDRLGYIAFISALKKYNQLNRDNILRCFFVPRSKDTTEDIKMSIRQNKVECAKLVKDDYKLTDEEIFEIRARFESEK